MLIVPALELSDPMLVFVLAKPDDALIHETRRRFNVED